jgi:methylmalonyl-CoA/ethylmalonyl-CoA epimerase
MVRVKKMDHIGIVVANMPEAIAQYRAFLFKEPSHTEFYEPERIELAFFDIGGVQVELLGPRDAASGVGAFLQEKGGGIHHICYEVEDLKGILKLLKEKGMKLIDEQPRPGSRNSQIAFVHPASPGGGLIEYCEFPGA